MRSAKGKILAGGDRVVAVFAARSSGGRSSIDAAFGVDAAASAVGKFDNVAGLEAQAISTRAATLSGVQDSQHTKDGWTTAAAVVIFWPAAFLVGGDKQTAAELAQMKGQMVAVEQASNAKKCGIQFQGARPPGT